MRLNFECPSRGVTVMSPLAEGADQLFAEEALAPFFFASADFARSIREPIVVMTGIFLLAVGIRQSYASCIAGFEIVKQYTFTARMFTNAKRCIDTCETDDERRGMLRVLG
jgi:hypothetical protein